MWHETYFQSIIVITKYVWLGATFQGLQWHGISYQHIIFRNHFFRNFQSFMWYQILFQGLYMPGHLMESFAKQQYQLEWGCPNGTKYPPRQPIQTLKGLHQIGEAVMRQKPFSVILALWPWPLTFWLQSPKGPYSTHGETACEVSWR